MPVIDADSIIPSLPYPTQKPLAQRINDAVADAVERQLPLHALVSGSLGFTANAGERFVPFTVTALKGSVSEQLTGTYDLVYERVKLAPLEGVSFVLDFFDP